MLGAERQHAGLVAAVEQRVAVLDERRAAVRERLPERGGVVVAESPQAADHPLGDELLEGGDRLGERRLGVAVVREVEVDPVDAEPLEAALDLAPDPVAREAPVAGSPVTGLKTLVVTRSPSGLAVGAPAADERLAAPAAVGVGRVEPADPGAQAASMISHASSSFVAPAEERGRRADAAEVAAAERDPRRHCSDCDRARQLVAELPELREEALVDQPAEHLDRRALRADDRPADDPLDDDEVAHAPDDDALVPLDQELGELVELLVLAAARVDLDERQARGLAGGVEGGAERRGDLLDARKPGESKPLPWPSTLRTSWYSQGERCSSMSSALGDDLQAVDAAAQQPDRAAEVAVADQARRLRDLGDRELQPELGGLVDGLEEELVAVGPLVRRLLKREQLVGAQVALVVGAALAGQHGLGELRLASRRALGPVVDLQRQVGERHAAVGRDEPGVLHVEAGLAVLRDRVRVHREDHVLRSSVSSPSPIFGNSIIVIPIEWPVTWPSWKPRSRKPFETARWTSCAVAPSRSAPRAASKYSS